MGEVRSERGMWRDVRGVVCVEVIWATSGKLREVCC